MNSFILSSVLASAQVWPQTSIDYAALAVPPLGLLPPTVAFDDRRATSASDRTFRDQYINERLFRDDRSNVPTAATQYQIRGAPAPLAPAPAVSLASAQDLLQVGYPVNYPTAGFPTAGGRYYDPRLVGPFVPEANHRARLDVVDQRANVDRFGANAAALERINRARAQGGMYQTRDQLTPTGITTERNFVGPRSANDNILRQAGGNIYRDQGSFVNRANRAASNNVDPIYL